MKPIFKKNKKKDSLASDVTTITIKKIDEVIGIPQDSNKEEVEKQKVSQRETQIDQIEKTKENEIMSKTQADNITAQEQENNITEDVQHDSVVTSSIELEKGKKKGKTEAKSLAKIEKKAKKKEKKQKKAEMRAEKRDKSKVWKKYRALKRGIVYVCMDFTDFCGEAIERYDVFYQKTNKKYHIFLRNKATLTYSIKKHLDRYSRVYAAYFFAALIISIGFVLIVDSVTCYAYSYNGRLLGYVKNQSDVVDVLGMVEDGLSDEHDREIQINVGENIAFEETTIFDKEVDAPDVVLNTLTYMQDIEASAYGIFIEGILIARVENKDDAEVVLESVKSHYAPEKEGVTYEEIAFVEEVTAEEIQSKLGNISNIEDAVSQIVSAEKKGESYTAKPEDTIESIATTLGISLETLLELNPDLQMDPETGATIITEGQKLVASLTSPVLTVTATASLDYQEEIPFEETKNNTDSLYKGETVVRTAGVVGLKDIVADVTYVNGVETSRDVLSETIIREPVTQIVDYGTNPTPPAVASGNFQLPTHGYTITSPFGPRWGSWHSGIDLASGYGTAIYAADGGVVTSAGWQGTYGYAIDIDHGNGLSTKYAHLSSMSVGIGTSVFKGQLIGGMGSTGYATGNHLHFEIRVGGEPVNPAYYISF